MDTVYDGLKQLRTYKWYQSNLYNTDVSYLPWHELNDGRHRDYHALQSNFTYIWRGNLLAQHR